ncbi:MAG: ABC transporter permease subunit [Luteitalea sp.]|nr:ABC transporter permease subunit [Luteitalea sp.]
MSRARRVGAVLLGVMVTASVLAPWLAPNPPGLQFRGYLLAPPMRPRLVTASGQMRTPFVYPLELRDRLTRTFEEDRSRLVSLSIAHQGRLVTSVDPRVPLLLLGADSLGRDVLARLLHGGRLSLGVAGVGVAGALLIGLIIGVTAGMAGHVADTLLMRVTELVIVLPVLYAVLALRAALPLFLPTAAVFAAIASVLALVGWPTVARGVRTIVATERTREYVLAARAAGASPWRIAVHHLLPATRSFLGTQALWLLPAFMLAEVTLSFVGLGFGGPVPSWGTMLQEAANVQVMRDAPWVLSPALAIALTVLGVNLLLEAADAPRS